MAPATRPSGPIPPTPLPGPTMICILPAMRSSSRLSPSAISFIAPPHHRSQTSDSFSQDPARSSAASDYSSLAGDLDNRLPGHGILPSSSLTSFDSSTAESPFKPRSKPAMPDIPPELVHLVDVVIMGRADSVDKIKTMVSTDSPNAARSIVDALLATMGGVEGFEDPAPTSSTPPSTMLSSRAAVVAADLIPWEGDSDFYLSPRTRMVKGLLVILHSCTRNWTMCSASGVLRVLLQSAEKLFVDSTDRVQWDGTPLCQCIRVLAGHSLSVADLHFWLGVIKKTLTTDWAMPLMIVLEKAMGSPEMWEPSHTFEFDGESSGLLGPGESRWPFASGYGFATWIYIESFTDTLNTAAAAAAIAAAAAARSGKSSPMSAAAAASMLSGEGTTHMPRLYCFLSSDSQGLEAYFHVE